MPRLPRPTLFPYATLFRSLLEQLRDVPEGNRGAHYVCAAALVRPDGDAMTAVGTCTGTIAYAPKGNAGFGYDPLFVIDRKSTRLNSSHSQISYAVFCLKKQ